MVYFKSCEVWLVSSRLLSTGWLMVLAYVFIALLTRVSLIYF